MSTLKFPATKMMRLVIRFFIKIFLTVCHLCFVFGYSAFANIVVTVIDKNGTPIQDAIIELEIDNKIAHLDITPPVYIMDQINRSFVPHVLAIPKSSEVSFPNSDDIRHHVYSFSEAKPFELKLYAGLPKAPILFEHSGIVVLGCGIHDAMVGYIYVHNNNKVYISNERGIININIATTQIKNLWLWHPRNANGVNVKEPVKPERLITNNNRVSLTIDILPPQTRDSFEDVFSHLH